MAFPSKKVIIRITALEKERYAPRGGESYATQEARIRVLDFLRLNRGPWTPSRIARAFGGNYYNEAALVRRACLSLWALGTVRKIAGATPKQTCYQWVG